jgi:hypothetical protein
MQRWRHHAMNESTRSPLIVYCDRGGMSNAVKKLRRRGIIRTIQGPYERRLRGAGNAIPSLVTADSTDLTADSTMLISDMHYSPKHSNIVEIIADPSNLKRTRNDALHLDSAVKSHAHAFVTSDKRDIVRHREKLESLLNLRIFHMPLEERQFLGWIDKQRNET